MNHSKFSAPKDRKKECGLDWHVAINKQPTAPIRAPVYSVYGFAKQTMAACRRIFSFSSPPPALFLTRRPLPWNHFLARPKPLSVLSSKMAAEHSKDYLSLAQPNTPALQAIRQVSYPLSSSPPSLPRPEFAFFLAFCCPWNEKRS